MPRMRSESPLRQLEAEVGEQRKRAVMAALFQAEGRIQKTADLLGCSRRTLLRDLRRWGIDKKKWQEFDPRTRLDEKDAAMAEAWAATIADMASLEEAVKIRDRAMTILARSGIRAALAPTSEDGIPAIMAVVEDEEEALGLPEAILGFSVVAFTRKGERRLGRTARSEATIAWWRAVMEEGRAAGRNPVDAHAVAGASGGT